ncbi:MAG: CPBP family intramembrane glutamic endopeptidase [Bacillota bacterium]
MKNKKAIFFLLVNFGISWTVGFIALYLGLRAYTGIYTIFAVFYMFIPAISVLIVQKVIYKETILNKLDVSFKINKWFIWGWLIPIIIAFLTFGISLLLPGVEYSSEMIGFLEKYESILSPEQFNQLKAQFLGNSVLSFIMIFFQVLIAGITVNAVAGFGEELGWRGLLQKELIKIGFWKSSFIIGFFWGIWHLPLILMGHNYPNNAFIGVLMMTMIGIFLGPIFSFIKLKSKSVIAASICHGSFNASLGLSILYIKGGSELLTGMTGLAGFIAIIIVDIFIYNSMYNSKTRLTLDNI